MVRDDKRTSLSERGITLEAVIITAVAALMAAAAGVVVYNVIRSESDDIDARAKTAQNVPSVFGETADGELIPIAPGDVPNPMPDNPTDGTTEDCEDGTMADLTLTPPQECRTCPGDTQTSSSAKECGTTMPETCDHGGMSTPPNSCVPCEDFSDQTGVRQVDCPIKRSRFTKIFSSGYHACGLSTSNLNGDGRLVDKTVASGNLIYCWGNNEDRQLNSGSFTGASSATLKTFPPASNENPINNIDEVSLGDTFSCIRRRDTAAPTGIGIWCWGSNTSLQLGVNDTDHRDVIPRALSDNSITTRAHTSNPPVTPTQLSLGQDVGCILGTVERVFPPEVAPFTGQSALCWGEGSFTLNGPLSVAGGFSDTFQSDRYKPVDILHQNGNFHNTGDILRRAFSQFGGLTNPNMISFRFDKLKDISVGNQHACVVREPFTNSDGDPRPNDRVYCWGDNSQEQLGVQISNRGWHNDFEQRRIISDLAQRLGNSSGVLFSGMRTVEKISAGNDFTCVIANTATITKGVWCWGLNHYGQVGVIPAGGVGNKGMSGNHIRAATRVSIGDTAITGALDIEVKGYRACIITSTDQLACWGLNKGMLPDRTDRTTDVMSGPFWTNALAQSKLYTGSTSSQQALPPTLIPGVSDVDQMIVMEAQVCVLEAATNTMKCFGADTEGRLGPYEDATIQALLGNP